MQIPAKIRKICKWAMRIFIAGGVLLFLDMFLYEPYFALHTAESEVFSKKWPKDLESVKIVVVSDFHAGRFFYDYWRMKKTVELVNREKPDIVLLLGDFFNRYSYNTVMPYEDFAKFMAAIEAPLGKFAVTGNHDTDLGVEKIAESLAGAGVKTLRNSSVKVDAPQGSFYIAGIPDFGTDIFNLEKTFRDVPEGEPCIFLTHDPSLFPALPRHAAASFAGHTHGGQFRIPYYGPILKCVVSLYREFSSDGLFINHRDDPLFITRGIGTSSIPARLFCTPQIEVIKIRHAD